VHATLAVNQPWVSYRPGATSTDVYMDITSSNAAKITTVSSSAAASATIAGSRDATIALPAGKMVRLARGGPRIVLHALAQPLRLGDYLALSLSVENSDGSHWVIPVRAEVRRRPPIDDERREHTHPKH
jgi:copper(I)-binding protein